MPKSKPFSLTIIVEEYDRYGGGAEARLRTYTGKDELAVLQKIADKHGYGRIRQSDLDLEGDGAKLTAKLVWDNIQDTNGDGCDYISAFMVGEIKALKYRGPKKG